MAVSVNHPGIATCKPAHSAGLGSHTLT